MENSTETSYRKENFKYDAFISYSSRDRDWVSKHLLNALKTAGLKPCIDYRDFEIGLPIVVNIEKAIESSRKTLLVLTPSWLSSKWTDFEALLIQTQDPAAWGQRILPLMVVETELPERLKMLTYLDLTEPKNRDFQFRRLINSISNNNAPQETSNNTSTTITSTSSTIHSDFSYFRGLEIMSIQFQTADIDIRLTFSSLDARLKENIGDENMFGPSETLRNERNRIIYQLNSLALKYLNKTFNEMCGM